jgi:DNA-binding CsgD family transcriptional regulator
VLVVDPESSSTPPGEILRKVLGLTPAETRLALALASGQSLREHAEAVKITIGTARQHLKRVLEKSGVRRQAELVRLVLSFFAAAEHR